MTDHFAMGPGGEFDLVRRMLDEWGELASGIGSDTAELSVPPGSRLLVSTDSIVENIHFRREWLTPRQIGYRAAAAALSDLAASAATPLGIFVALSAPPAWVDEIPEIAAGIGDATRDAGATINGGDLSRATELSITITVLGVAEQPLSRMGARPGNRIIVTGDLGRCAAALEKLAKGGVPPSGEMERFAHPVVRIRESRWLAAHGATSSIDISDGLGSELSHLAAASEVRLQVELERIPVVSGIAPLEALRSGEEYELLMTVPASLSLEEFRSAFSTSVTEIGLVVSGDAGVELMQGGERIALPRGHNHF